MKKIKFFVAALGCSILALPLVAKDVTLNWGNGQTITVTDLDDDLVKVINDHKGEIENALATNGVDKATVESAVTQAKDAYNKFKKDNPSISANPYTNTINGISDFTDILVDVIPNSQIQQNVWANAWIGYILPKPNFGFGINTGVSKLDLRPIVKVADALGMKEAKDIPETLVWPTITADLRVGGFILPFDVGFNVMTFDSSSISSLKQAIDPAFFDCFMIGGDIRYAILKGGILRPKLSVGVGGFYTKGSFAVEQNGSTAQLDFNSTSLVLSTQASIKLLCFVPFAGARVMFSKSNVDWNVNANWASILDTKDAAIKLALDNKILPSKFSGGSSSNFGDHVRPVLFGGFAIDMMVVDLTLSGSYDFISKIPSGALSLRFALN